MGDKNKESNIDNEFTDINKESKSKPYIIVGILYLLVIILSILLIIGLKHQKDTINNSIDNTKTNDNVNQEQSNNNIDNNINNSNSDNINNTRQHTNSNQNGNTSIFGDDTSIIDYLE